MDFGHALLLLSSSVLIFENIRQEPSLTFDDIGKFEAEKVIRAVERGDFRQGAVLLPKSEQDRLEDRESLVAAGDDGGDMTLDNILTFAGLVLVAWEMRDGNKQSKLESQIRLYDINRELISLGFSKPELFEVLKDEKKADPTIERWYLQLWLNQLSLFHSLKVAGVLQKDYRESVEHDLRDMFGMSNMRRHWENFQKFYPASFRRSVNDILHEAGYELTGEKADEPKR